jgi:hypothetical protein
MFASLIVVLPSPFTGSDAYISHGGHSKVLSSSQQTGMETTVLAWYTDVMHEVKPITSGYRLALAHNLVHTTNALRPTLNANEGVLLRLRHVLSSWRQAPEDKPQKLVFLLEHMYSQANLSASAMKDKDAHVVALLDGLSCELGFHLGFVNIEGRVEGVADDNGPGR